MRVVRHHLLLGRTWGSGGGRLSDVIPGWLGVLDTAAAAQTITTGIATTSDAALGATITKQFTTGIATTQDDALPESVTTTPVATGGVQIGRYITPPTIPYQDDDEAIAAALLLLAA